MSGAVAVLGASGGVGAHAARMLAVLGAGRLRLGARRVEAAPGPAGGPDTEIVAVDLWDDARLAEFCSGVDVVVNCAGPSYRVVDRVARAAAAAGAGYVDPGGDVPLFRALSAASGRTAAVVNAGLMPGLTSILPRWLATGMRECRSLTAHVGLLDRLTPVGAAEYLLTLAGEHGEAMAAWRDGARRSRALQPDSAVRVPFFPAPVDLQPYLSLETERLAARLGVSDVDWWNAFDGAGNMLRTLGRLQAEGIGGDVEPAARQLCAAAELDLFGREPYQILLFRLDGSGENGQRESRTLLLRGTDTYELTAAVAAFTAQRLLDGAVPPGAHHVEDVVDPAALCAWLREQPVVSALERLDAGTGAEGAVDGAVDDAVEEGAL
ncbi:saccharopine dehydrogenase NADP-binding domain-containing protein [Qaidamihabitans albus]|uniref:saccharopine dehydrogenase NADP-binding domain-containing protein n=1 Tax=Qaidamihabitans albus TaxID=2795733 RepID=UPI001B3563FA|nr:saccharopine dehydrogenase NADP-binding domain-containing protein [Qaidamihabitans albus]